MNDRVSRKDWARGDLMTFFVKSTHITPPQNFNNKKVAIFKHLCKVN